jgi:hypothetical protein
MPRAAMTLYEQLKACAAGRSVEALEMRAFPPPTQRLRRTGGARAVKVLAAAHRAPLTDGRGRRASREYTA